VRERERERNRRECCFSRRLLSLSRSVVKRTLVAFSLSPSPAVTTRDGSRVAFSLSLASQNSRGVSLSLVLSPAQTNRSFFLSLASLSRRDALASLSRRFLFLSLSFSLLSLSRVAEGRIALSLCDAREREKATREPSLVVTAGEGERENATHVFS